MEMAKVTSKGQITIPISIRKRLEINEGDKILFIDTPEGVLMVNPNTLSGSAIERQPQKQSAPPPQIKTEREKVRPQATTLKVSPRPVETHRPASMEVINAAEPASAKLPEPDIISVNEAEIAAIEDNGGEKAKAPSHGLDLNSLLDEIRSIRSSSNI